MSQKVHRNLLLFALGVVFFLAPWVITALLPADLHAAATLTAVIGASIVCGALYHRLIGSVWDFALLAGFLFFISAMLYYNYGSGIYVFVVAAGAFLGGRFSGRKNA